MQRGKFYNLQSKAYFNCILFVFEKKQNSVRPIVTVAKSHFFLHKRKTFFLISSFYDLIRFLKKRNIPEDAAWKALQFTKNSLFLLRTFCFRKKKNSV